MATVSLCMIVRNEAHTLEKCLNSIEGAVDEMVIVDTGSSDGTREVAGRFTDKVYDFEWVDDFAAARNFAYDKATMDYIMWLDADDILLPEDKAKLIALKKSIPPEVDAVMMKYNTGFDDIGNVVFSYYRERLSKRSRGFLWHEPVHEYLAVGGNIINADICVTHTKKHAEPNSRNINIYEGILAEGKTLSPRGMYYYARELKDKARYTDAIRMFREFLDSGKGWTEDNISACGELAKCYLAVNEHEKSLAAMFESFKYDSPRAELCCQIGYWFKGRGDYRLAAFWFSLVLTLQKPSDTWGFIQHDCWGYIPCIECAVCYDKLGNYELAERFNNRAAVFNPDSHAVTHNRQYFEAQKVLRSI